MPDDRWQRVKTVLGAALKRPVEARAAFLREACGHDDSLRGEVESLIAAGSEAGGFLSQPARLEDDAPPTASFPGRLATGARLGPYEIVSFVGAGGMGEVYKARDTRLDRTVAIKVLRADTASPHVHRRFEREARTISQLSHPHICGLYDVGQHEGASFLVMEYLEGETLAERLRNGPLPLEQALGYATHIAEALAEAHQHGVVHRDLKPANVVLTKKGAKLLDFGIAKLRSAVPEDEESSRPEILTREGLVIGTFGYMAPEQLEGKEADERTDIFAFGLVLYEMVSGCRAFEAPSAAGLIAAILKGEPPPLSQAHPPAPPWLEAVVQRCLAKDPAARWPSAGDLATALQRREDGRAVPSAPRRRTLVVRALGVAAGIAALVTAAVVATSRRAPALTGRDSVLVGGFVNATGDPAFDDALQEALATHLRQSPFFHLVADNRVRQALSQMGRSPDEALTPAVERQVCERVGAAALITGRITAEAGLHSLELQASRCSGDRRIRARRGPVPREEVLRALDAATNDLRRSLGEPPESIARFNRSMETATRSLAALRAYTLGLRHRNRGSNPNAIPFLKQAVELDPDFVIAHHSLGMAYQGVFERRPAMEHLQRAFDLRDRASDRDRLSISGNYHMRVTGDLTKAVEALEVFRQTYPRDPAAPNNLIVAYSLAGEPEKALERGREALRVDPETALAYANMMSVLQSLGRWDEAAAMFEQAAARGLDTMYLHRNRYIVAFAQGDAARMRRESEWATGRPDEQSLRLFEGFVAAARGRPAESRQHYRRAYHIALRAGLRQAAGEILVEEAVTEAYLGDRRGTAASVEEALALDPSPGFVARASLALAVAGDADGAERLLVRATRAAPATDTVLQGYYLPVARAAIALARGSPETAVQALQPAAPYDRGFYRQMQYLRGLALRRSGRPAEAAADFRRLADNRGWSISACALLSYPLAHLELARASAATGDRATSEKMYAAFLSLWAEADPGLPLLAEARREAAAVHRAGRLDPPLARP